MSLPAAETDSSYVDNSSVSSAPDQIIECLCSTIRNMTEVDTCAGVLVSNNNKHRVWVPRAPLISARVASLAELLSLPAPPMEERLKLSVRLASSVLQLHETEWLQERWGKHDIFLIQGDSSQSGNPSLETPAVRHTFAPEPLTPEAPTESRIIHGNLSLFSLGIILIELWFWRSVESFQADIPQARDPDTGRFTTALGLIEKLNEDAGMNYGSSVQHCIQGVDHKETKVESNKFKSKAYGLVLEPLERSLEVFCGKPLEKIFEKKDF